MIEDPSVIVALETATATTQALVTIWNFHFVVIMGVATILGFALADGREISPVSRVFLTVAMVGYGAVSFIALAQRYETLALVTAYLSVQVDDEVAAVLAQNAPARALFGAPLALLLHPPSVALFIAYAWWPRRAAGGWRRAW